MSTKQTIENQEPDRRPKALRYGDRMMAVEEMIVEALPGIARKLISMANEGDLAAARYLFDRIGGRPTRLPSPPSIDRTLPYEIRDWTADQLVRNDRRQTIIDRYVPPEAYGRPTPPKAKPSTNFPGIGSSRSIDDFKQQ